MTHHDPIADAKAQEATQNFTFRTATVEDLPAINAMIEESLRGLALGTGFYTQAELDGSIGYLFGADTLLIHDQTYFILHPTSSPSTISACGGWSFRRTLYGADTAPGRMPESRDPLKERASIRAIFTHPSFARKGLGTMMMRYCEARARERGFRGLEMGSTLPGVALYEKCGYVKSGKGDRVVCPNGEGIRIVHMVKDPEGWVPGGGETGGGDGEKVGRLDRLGAE
ncbi:acyl-CoA N-acyltransferase [Lophiotrema nucula]|uniref:Acyl-CoA N-acyltransferase n=1 Tax=Lophiotrema nucula TaxID=690887 RepID=A0A6A5ZDM3_9PLEO|nr:acyl-CoA N-acyltransferase [Lophiotrema nucula]